MLRSTLVVLTLAAVACRRPAPTRDTEKYTPDAVAATSTPSSANTGKKPRPPAMSPVSTMPDTGNTPGPETQMLPSGDMRPQDPSRPYNASIGSNCSASLACGGWSNVCFTDYPDGLCSRPCSHYCPDIPTFCIADRSGEGGVCVAKCSSNADCRPGYICALEHRFNEHSKTAMVCVPAVEQHKSCEDEFAALPGAYVMPWSPEPQEALLCTDSVACTVNAPMRISPVMNDVTLVQQGVAAAEPIPVSCRMAHTLYRMTDSLRTLGVSQITFSRLYACEDVSWPALERPHALSGAEHTSGLLHAQGNSLDIAGFTIDGVEYTVNVDWGTFEAAAPNQSKLVPVIQQLTKDRLFNNVYTPTCNQMFDGFIHVDLAALSAAEMMTPTFHRGDDPDNELCRTDFSASCDE